MRTERYFSQQLESILLPATPIHQLEKLLFTLASQNAADAIFYGAFFKFGKHLHFRYFEHGEYVGFSHILRRAGNNEVLPWQIYTPRDVEKNRTTHKPEEQDRMYRSKLAKIKQLDIGAFNGVKGIDCTFLLISTVKRARANSQRCKLAPYFYCSDNETVSKNWKQLLDTVRTLKPKFDTSLDKTLTGPLSLPEQFEYISLLPNLHTWNWCDEGGTGRRHGIRQEQLFSSSYK